MIEDIEPPLNECRAQLHRMFARRDFKRAPDSMRLLEELGKAYFEDREDRLKEYKIGLFLGKSSGWSPTEDTLVRTRISQLRARLSKHFAGAGLNDPILVTIPAGGYAVKFSYRLAIAPYPGITEEERAFFSNLKGALLRRSILGNNMASALVSYLYCVVSDNTIPLIMKSFGWLASINLTNGKEAFELASHTMAMLDRGGWIDKLPLWQIPFVNAVIRAGHDRDWQGALNLFEKALDSSHGESLNFWWHTATLSGLGRLEQAADLLRSIIDKVPTAVTVNVDLAIIYILSGRLDDARRVLAFVHEMTGRIGSNHIVNVAAAMIFDATEDWTAGLSIMRKIVYSPNDYGCWLYGYTPYFLAKSGNIPEAKENYRWLQEQKASGAFMPALQLAVVAVGLGEHDDALSWLETATREYDPYLLWLRLLPCFKDLRGSARFESLLQQLNLNTQSLDFGRSVAEA